MHKKRPFLHIATMILIAGLWSCTPARWPSIDQNRLQEDLNQLTQILHPVSIMVEPANLKVRFFELPFFPSHGLSRNCTHLEQWSSQCEKEHHLYYPTLLNRWLPYLIHYPPNRHQFGGIVLKFQKIGLNGLLFLYPSSLPRPLYIVRGGIGSRYDSFFVERPLLLTLIHHLKAHVLFLGSSVNDVTLNEFNYKNSGPFADYYHNYYLLKVFSSEKLARYFSDIYLIAISLSGLGGYLSANFDPLENQAPSFKKVFLLCPFLNYPLKVPNIKDFWYYQTTKFWALRRFRRSLESIGLGLDEHPLIPIFKKLDSTQSELINSGYYSEILKTTLELDNKDEPTISEEVSGVNGNLSLFSHKANQVKRVWKTKSHINVLLSKMDPIVNPYQNGATLSEKNQHVNWFSSGFHCQFYLAYPTETVSHFFK